MLTLRYFPSLAHFQFCDSVYKKASLINVATFSDVVLVSNYHICIAKKRQDHYHTTSMIDILFKKAIAFQNIRNHIKFKQPS